MLRKDQLRTFILTAVLAVSICRGAMADSRTCREELEGHAFETQALQTAFTTGGVQKIFQSLRPGSSVLSRILSLVNVRQIATQLKSLSLVVVVDENEVLESRKLIWSNALAPQIATYFIKSELTDLRYRKILKQHSGVIFISRGALDSFLDTALSFLAENGDNLFEGIYVNEDPDDPRNPEIQAKFARLSNHSNTIQFGVSTLANGMQQNLTAQYGHSYVSPLGLVSIKPDLQTFLNRLEQEGISRKKTYLYWREKEGLENFPIDPAKTYGDKWPGWTNLKGHWVTFEEFKEIVRAAGIKTVYDFDHWRSRPINVPSDPKGTYPDQFTTYSDVFGVKLRTSPALIKILPYYDALPIARAWNLANNIKSIKKYAARKDRPSVLPLEPQRYYRNSGWVSSAVWLGLEDPPVLSQLPAPEPSDRR